VLLHLKEVSVIHYVGDHVLDVIGHVAFGWNDGVELFVGAVDWVGGWLARRLFKIIRGDEAEQLANHREALSIVVGEKMCHARLGVVSDRAA
jgi:hypothetical protein